jgi:FkbM family methyltransferase
VKGNYEVSSELAYAPLPSKANVLQRLKSHVPISAVVDVGVRECTWDLIKQLPDRKHFLFEPNPSFHAEIERFYSALDHQAFAIALSDADVDHYLVSLALEWDGVVTHSQIWGEPASVDGRRVVACDPISVRRFDSLGLSREISRDFLLKVDVDGKELQVLRGFGGHLVRASVVIVECTFSSAIERMGFLADSGFELVDIVDLCYYGPSLYQFDAVFLRRKLVTPALRPPISDFVRKLWCPLAL